jgi:hypothetical protein
MTSRDIAVAKLLCKLGTEKGMIFGYGINHEEVAWNIRQEPGLISAYEKVHDTSDLLVSFDSESSYLMASSIFF